MYDYIVDELPALIEARVSGGRFPVGISGHSMGGHGALTIALKTPVVSARSPRFHPICSPLNCPWGEKALGNYLGPDRASWREYDTTVLVASADAPLPVLVDQGTADNFLEEQLKTPLLEQGLPRCRPPMTIRMQEDMTTATSSLPPSSVITWRFTPAVCIRPILSGGSTGRGYVHG